MSALKDYAALDKIRWPLLNLACKNEQHGTSSKVEWVWSTGNAQLQVSHNHNYVQVFRALAWEDLLDSIERSLALGVRSFDPSGANPSSYMGSIRELLGRHEREGDYISLRILQDLRSMPGSIAGYFAEVSVIARQGS